MSERYDAAKHRPAVLLGTAEWSSRRPAGTPESPAELAARVEAALDRADGLMFTVTPREELDAVAQWQLVADQAWCGQLREVVASTARLSAADRDFVGDELALALGMSSGAGRALVWQYGSIAALPGLVEAVESGRISRRHVLALTDVLDEVDLSLEQRQAVVLIGLASYVDQTPARWAEQARRLLLTVDPAAAGRRRDAAASKRRAVFYPQPDQQGAMWLQAAVELVAAAQARVAAEARRLKAAGDERSMEQLTCDVALELLTHGVVDGRPATSWDVQVVTPLSVLEGGDTEVADLPGWGPLLPSTARELARQAGAFTQVAVDAEGQVVAVSDRMRADVVATSAEPVVDTCDTDDADRANGAPATAPGTADAAPDGDAEGGARAQGRRAPAREVAPDVSTVPVTPVGSDDFLVRAVVAMRRRPTIRSLDSRRYRPGGRLTRLVQARDRTCVFPGCTRPARQTDLDHREPWPRGRTTAENLQCLCRHHHRAKHAVFTVISDPDDERTVLWITRGGWVFRRRPSGC